LKIKGVGVDISASSIILFNTPSISNFVENFLPSFLTYKILFGFEIFSKKIDFRGLKLKVKIKGFGTKGTNFDLELFNNC
jgi:hypothetical protein